MVQASEERLGDDAAGRKKYSAGLLKAAPIPAIYLNSFPNRPHIIHKTLVEFEHRYPLIATISQLKLPYLCTALSGEVGVLRREQVRSGVGPALTPP
jgi:hypothetical protein